MIHHIDAAVESFVRQVVGVPNHVADVVFAAPSAITDSSMARPTFAIYLWQIVPHHSLSRGGFEDHLVGSRPARRPPSPFLKFRYFITVSAGESRDEHALLGEILTSVLAHDKLPQETLPEPLKGLRIGLELADEGEEFPASLLEANKIRLGLSITVAVPAEIGEWIQRGAPIESVALSASSIASPTPARAGRAGEQPLRKRRDGSAIVMEGRSENSKETPS